jgi:hypothetical protein
MIVPNRVVVEVAPPMAEQAVAPAPSLLQAYRGQRAATV